MLRWCRHRALGLPLLFSGWATVASAGDCIPYTEAGKHVGEHRCISGTVLDVKAGAKGVTFFDYCEDYRVCPFTVVVFPRDLKHVGDVRQLKGRPVEIHGDVKEYDGRAEIILRDYKQLGGEAARIPPLPKGFDVEKKGHYSAGKLSYPAASKKPRRKKQPAPIQTQESEPEPE